MRSDEDFKKYKDEQKAEAGITKLALKGRLFFSGGTYCVGKNHIKRTKREASKRG